MAIKTEREGLVGLASNFIVEDEVKWYHLLTLLSIYAVCPEQVEILCLKCWGEEWLMGHALRFTATSPFANHQLTTVPVWAQNSSLQTRLHMILPPRTIEEWTYLLTFQHWEKTGTIWCLIAVAETTGQEHRLHVQHFDDCPTLQTVRYRLEVHRYRTVSASPKLRFMTTITAFLCCGRWY